MLGGEVGWRVSFQFESQAGFMPHKLTEGVACPGRVSEYINKRSMGERFPSPCSPQNGLLLPPEALLPPVEAHNRRVLFPPVTMPGLTLPLYIRMTGLHAAIGLRFKLYSLRTLGGEERPACLGCHTPRAVWCSPHHLPRHPTLPEH